MTINVVAAPFGACKHGTKDYLSKTGVTRGREFCAMCKKDRRTAAKQAAKTRAANGTCWSRSFIGLHLQTFKFVPAWLSAKHEDRGDWVICNDGMVYSPSRSPVWIVDVQTYRLESLLELERLKELLRGRIVLGNGEAPLFAGLASLTIAPYSAIDGGEDLELYGFGGRR